MDLHLHDLRREFGSRLLEAGADLREVRDAFGHSSLTMTNTYLASTRVGLRRAFDRYERAHGEVDAETSGAAPAADNTVH